MSDNRMDDADAIEWLKDCGWHGWMHDLLTNEVFTADGGRWRTPLSLVRYLQHLHAWPRMEKHGRNIPVPRKAMQS